MMPFEEVVRSAVSRLGVVRVSNALNPLLYISLFVCPVSWFAAWLFADDPVLKYALIGFGSIFPLAFLIHYSRFAFSDPNRLQSEEHVARMRELSIIARKGRSGPELIPPSRADLLMTEQEVLPQDRSREGQ